MAFSLLAAACLDAPDGKVGAPAAGVSPSAVQHFNATGALLPPPAEWAPGVPEYYLTGHVGGEPTIAATSKGTLFAAGGDETLRSRDQGSTWKRVYNFNVDGLPPDPVFGGDVMFTNDQIMFVDPRTDRVFTSHLYPLFACTSLIWSDDDGDSWFERHGACTTPMVDFQKIGAGRPGPVANPLVTGQYRSVLYLCFNKWVAYLPPITDPAWAFATDCMMSYDGGLTWPLEVPIVKDVYVNNQGLVAECSGSAGPPVTARDGTVIVPIPCNPIQLVTSRDSGLTWSRARGPGNVLGGLVDLAFASDDTLFAYWPELVEPTGEQIPHLGRSADLGRSWDEWPILPPGVVSTQFGVIETKDPSRIAVAFLATKEPLAKQYEAGPNTPWYLFIVTSDNALDAEPTFTSYQVTPDEDPVHVGPICWLTCPPPDSRIMLDFIGSTVAPDGTFYVSYTETCMAPCPSQENRKGIVAVATLRDWTLG